MHQLPLPEKENAPAKKTIYINPNFKAHINPLFVNPPPVRMIHMNPQFLQAAQLVDYQKQHPNVVAPTQIAAVHINPTRKLVRNNAAISAPVTTIANSISTSNSFRNNKLIAAKPVSVVSPTRKYKIDRRPVVTKTSLPPPQKLKLIRKGSDALSKGTVTSLPTPPFATQSIKKQKVNERRLRLVNINGILFRSTYNKLQRKDDKTNSAKPKHQSSKMLISRSKRPLAKSLFVNGSKFMMDPTGFRLKRLPSQTTINTASSIRQRINIGGVTFVAASCSDEFVRTRTHLTKAYLNNAKHRSLQLLTKHLVKSNIPCAIFQRLGKCKSFERGKCNKVHDKKQVIICPKFLQGECSNGKCLLSHNVSLSKMPVCKFYLQGVCVRKDCPYLHKKLSRTTEICQDFLQGFCRLAEKCNKRHEFICPRVDASGNCISKSCMFCRSSKKRMLQKKNNQKMVLSQKTITPIPAAVPITEEKEEQIIVPTVRYFFGKANADSKEKQDNITAQCNDDEDEDEDDNSSMISATLVPANTRPKLGTLPAFIPLT